MEGEKDHQQQCGSHKSGLDAVLFAQELKLTPSLPNMARSKPASVIECLGFGGHWLPRAHAHGCPFHHFSACAPACGSGGDSWREWLWPSQRLAKAGRFPGAVWGKKIVGCQPNEFCHWSPWRLGKKPCLRRVELPCIRLVYELFQRPLVREVSAYGLLRVQQLVKRNHVCAAMLRSTFTDTLSCLCITVVSNCPKSLRWILPMCDCQGPMGYPVSENVALMPKALP